MYSEWVPVVLVAVFVWLLILSFLTWWQKGFLETLFPKSGERDIRKKFEEVLNEISKSVKDLKEIGEKLSKLEADGLKHIQRVELLRYNPYEDTGGDISFSLALLNDKGSGIVLTSLHARSGTRVFAKPITFGKGQKYQLSKEEQEVIDQALKK